MTLAAILRSLGFDPLIKGLTSPLFVICALLGLLGACFPAPPLPGAKSQFIWFLAAPFLEEFTWRTLLQGGLERFLPCSPFPFTQANIISSAAFALAHVLLAPVLMAALTFFPSLLFGLLWTKFHSTWLCGLLHLWYNLAQRLL